MIINLRDIYIYIFSNELYLHVHKFRPVGRYTIVCECGGVGVVTTTIRRVVCGSPRAPEAFFLQMCLQPLPTNRKFMVALYELRVLLYCLDTS